MFRRAQQIAAATFLALIPVTAGAQAVLQPAPAPVVTAESTTWFQAAQPIESNGALYYQAGAVRFFDRNQMVRSGSFNGIPLYTDTTLEPNSVVFVPLSGGRMQPYERQRTGDLTGTIGSLATALPPVTPTAATAPEPIRQAMAPPAFAAPYDPALVAPVTGDASIGSIPQPTAVGTTGRSVPTRATTLHPPTGLNSIWINFDGKRWVSRGKAIDYDAASLMQVGTYHGWSVYTRNGDRSTIYIPTTPGRLAPYTAR